MLRPNLEAAVGERGGGGCRKVWAERLPDDSTTCSIKGLKLGHEIGKVNRHLFEFAPMLSRKKRFSGMNQSFSHFSNSSDLRVRAPTSIYIDALQKVRSSSR